MLQGTPATHCMHSCCLATKYLVAKQTMGCVMLEMSAAVWPCAVPPTSCSGALCQYGLPSVKACLMGHGSLICKLILFMTMHVACMSLPAHLMHRRLRQLSMQLLPGLPIVDNTNAPDPSCSLIG